ncbi:MAG: hypothetical protein IKY80_02805 [Alistipes sp.]|nr:hypothetical protein [Alistipes sp.]
MGLRECIDYSSVAGRSPITFDVVGDYNFRRGKSVSFFVGAGVGCTDIKNYFYDESTSGMVPKTMFHFMPRAGAELFNHIRMTAYANIFGDKETPNGVGLSAGVVFGGSRIERKEYNKLHFEFEPFLGASSGALLVGLEARYNFNRPWDIGLNFAGDFKGLRLTTVGDYSFYRGKNTTLFCGLGAGYANTRILNIDEAIDEYGDACVANSSSCVCVYPRVGVEFFRRLRLTAAAVTYNMKKIEPAITLGVAIGGGKMNK